MGATVETIEIERDEQAPHNFGAVTRWMVMYPPHTSLSLYDPIIE